MRLITEISEYDFSDMRPSDRVLDIGANCGAFAWKAAHIARHVTAIEPIVSASATVLRTDNIKWFSLALGDGEIQNIRWDEVGMRVQTYPLKRLIEIAGGCDFLKVDCEGAEWTINPHELQGIRRIEMELHTPPISPYTPEKRLLGYIGRHYRVNISDAGKGAGIGVVGILHAYEVQS